MKHRGIFVLLLLVLFPVVCYSQEIDEAKVDKLLLVFFEVMTVTYFVWTLGRPQFFLLFFFASLLVLVWNGLFVGWATIFYLNLGSLPVALGLACMSRK